MTPAVVGVLGIRMVLFATMAVITRVHILGDCFMGSPEPGDGYL